MLSKTIRNLLLDPRIKDSSLDRDGVDLLRVHSEVIKSKTMIRHIFQEFLGFYQHHYQLQIHILIDAKFE